MFPKLDTFLCEEKESEAEGEEGDSKRVTQRDRC